MGSPARRRSADSPNWNAFRRLNPPMIADVARKVLRDVGGRRCRHRPDADWPQRQLEHHCDRSPIERIMDDAALEFVRHQVEDEAKCAGRLRGAGHFRRRG